MTTHYAGIDIAAKSHIAVIIPRDAFNSNTWRTWPTITLTNCRHDYDAFARNLPPGAPVALEPTGIHYSAPLLDFLKRANHNVQVIHNTDLAHLRAQLVSAGDKNDPTDARLLAAALYFKDDPALGPALKLNPTTPDLDAFASRLLLNTRHALIKQRTQTLNRLRQYLHAVFPEAEPDYFEALTGTTGTKNPLNVLVIAPLPADLLNLEETTLKRICPTRPKRQRLITLARDTIGTQSAGYRHAIRHNARILDTITAHLADVEAALLQLAADLPTYPLLLTIPSISPVEAATLAVIIGDIHRYPTKAKLRKHLSCYATTGRSGTSVSYNHRGTAGTRWGKTRIHLLALRLLSSRATPDNPVRRYIDRRKRLGRNHNMANARTKLVDIIHAMLSTGEPFRLTPRKEHQPCAS